MSFLGSLAGFLGIANKDKISSEISLPVLGVVPVSVLFHQPQTAAPAGLDGVQWGVQVARDVWSADVTQSGISVLSNMDVVKQILLDRARYAVAERNSEVIGATPQLTISLGAGEPAKTNWTLILGLAAVSVVLAGGYMWMKRKKRK